MFSKIILCATNNKLIAGTWRMGKLQSHQVFVNDPQGHEDFSRFLKFNLKTSLYLLADAIEEDYRSETLPHATGNARAEMIDRKLTQLYRTTNYRLAHFIERETVNRKDDKFVMAALTNPSFLDVWVNIIKIEKAPLAGIYLLSMMSQEIVRSMKLNAPDLLLSERLSSGLRQTYFNKGQLRISRLAPITIEAQSKLGYFYLTETEKTRLYLISQRLVGRETKLAISLPAHDESSESICRDIAQETGMECGSVDIVQFARGLNLEPKLLRDNPELLHMHLLAISRKPDNIAPVALTKQYQINKIRVGILSLAALVLLAGLFAAGFYYLAALNNAKQIQQDLAETAIQTRLYDEVAKNFPKTDISGNDLQAAAELAKTLQQYKKPPIRVMQVISNAIATAPELQINRMKYMLSNEVEPKDVSEANVITTNTTSTVNPATSFVPDPTQLYEVAFIEGEIRGFNGDYREALEKVNQLAERFKNDPSVAQVLILNGPVNVSSYTNLQGNTNDAFANEQAAALFKLRIILKKEEVKS